MFPYRTWITRNTSSHSFRPPRPSIFATRTSFGVPRIAVMAEKSTDITCAGPFGSEIGAWALKYNTGFKREAKKGKGDEQTRRLILLLLFYFLLLFPPPLPTAFITIIVLLIFINVVIVRHFIILSFRFASSFSLPQLPPQTHH